MDNKPKQDFDSVVRNNLLSVKPCDVCGNSVGIRNVRQKVVLCANCTNKSGSMSRYTNFQHGRLTPAEQAKIQQDKTVRRGPFYDGKETK